MTRPPAKIIMLVESRFNLLDLSAPMQAFMATNKINKTILYEMLIVSSMGGLITSSCGLQVITYPASILDGLKLDTLIIPGGCEAKGFHERSALVALVERLTPHVRRLCSLSTGIFVLAALGQLTSIVAATHWNWALILRERHPEMTIDADRLFSQDGKIWTSAGLASSLDLALGLIEQDHGPAMAMKVARQLVMFSKRSGLQSQLSVSLEAQTLDDWMFTELHAWIACHLRDDLSVPRLAKMACMTPRTFARTYVGRLGRTPAKTVEAMRLEAACRALESTASPLKAIAAKVGLISEQSMLRVFKRALDMSPGEYRRRFSNLNGKQVNMIGH